MLKFADILQSNLNVFKQRIIDNLKSHNVEISNDTASKIKIEVTQFEGKITVPFWFPVFQDGRRPRRSTKNYELWKIIKDWGLRHNVFDLTKDIDRQAKSITWFINKYGTKLFRQIKDGGKPRDIYQSLIPFFIEKISLDLSETIGAYIKTDLLNTEQLMNKYTK